MRKASLLSCALVATFTVAASPSHAELTEKQKECGKALDRAYSKMLEERNASSEKVNSASTNNADNQNSGGSNAGSAVSDMVNKIAEGNQKKAELLKQKMEQERQVNTEQFKQVMALEDKEREIAREKSKLPIEIKDAEFEKKKVEAETRMKCQGQAEKQYQALLENTANRVSASQHTVNSLSAARGTNARMRSKRKEFYNKCMADPNTQDLLQLAIDDLNRKLHKFNVQSGIFNSDLEYTRSKLPKLVGHMDEQRRYIAQTTDLQMDALDQAQKQAEMGLMFAVLSSASSSGERQKSAANYSSADEVLNNWELIQRKCLNDDYGNPYSVPSDLLGAFGEVNRVCKPSSVENPENACVKSNGQPSYKPRNDTSIGV